MKEDNTQLKLDKIEKNCINSANEDFKKLKNENDASIEKIVNEEVEKYKNTLDEKYKREVAKLEKEYNKEIYNYSMNSKRKERQFEDTLILNLHKEIIEIFCEYTDDDEYEKYLFSNIEKVLEKIQRKEESIIYITENDIKRFGEKIKAKYDVEIKKIDNDYIGGVILLNNTDKVSIDNTLKTNIEEKIKKIHL